MKKNRVWLFLGGYILIIILFFLLKPKEINWQERFLPTGEEPFDLALFYAYLKEKKPNTEYFEYSLADSLPVRTPYNFIYITNSYFDSYEKHTILEEARKGNHILVSKKYFYNPDTFDLLLKNIWFGADTQFYGIPLSTKTTLQFSSPSIPDVFPFYYDNSYYAFLNKDSSAKLNKTCLSTTINGDCIFVKVEVGNGAVYFHSMPLVFTNFAFAQKDFWKYPALCLQYLPHENTYLDVYHNPHFEPENVSLLRVIDRNPALRIAWYLLLTGGLIFLFFFGRRKQRVIPEIHAKQNQSIQFAMNLAELHYKNQNARDLLMKRITFLQNYLFNHFRLKNLNFDSTEAPKVAEQTGLDLAEVRILWERIKYIQTHKLISNDLFLEINSSINHFYQQLQS